MVRAQARRGTILVLVMTLLSILFVLGVAFLATMNFEAEMIAAQVKQRRVETGVEAVVEELCAVLQDQLVADSGVSTDGTAALTAVPELPGDHGLFAPLDPYWDPGPDPNDPADDFLAFRSFTDLEWMVHGAHSAFYSGPYPDNAIAPLVLPANVLSGDTTTGLPAHVLPVDADGDGITDSLAIDAQAFGLSPSVTASIAETLNGPADNAGALYVGLRVLPHGAMVNVNNAHPRLIQNVLGLPTWPARGDGPDPNLGYFVHRPTQTYNDTTGLSDLYAPAVEEPILRRRLFLPPQAIPPSRLHGNVLLTDNDQARGDLYSFLFPPPGPNDPNTVLGRLADHRYWPVTAEETSPSDPNLPLWAVRMEPSTGLVAHGDLSEYDRRHLITTISHDDLLARGSMVLTGTGLTDIRAAMIDANVSNDPNATCPTDPDAPNPRAAMPFEYVNYPHTLRNDVDQDLLDGGVGDAEDCACGLRDFCDLDVRKGRLKLSLAWLDDMVDLITTDPDNETINAVQWERVIHDAFMLLVRNAMETVTAPTYDAATGNDIVCANDAQCPQPPPPQPPSVCILEQGAPGFCTCRNNADCRPGAVCKARPSDGRPVCTWEVPYFADETCNTGTQRPREVCLPTGLLGDPWTLQRRSQQLLSRTAASLTANLLDYIDGDNVPTRVALRSFDFSGLGVCVGGPGDNWQFCRQDTDCPSSALGACRLPPGDCFSGPNNGQPCTEFGTSTQCPGGTCRSPADTVGRAFGEVQTVAGFPKPVGMQRPIQYVYGVERQPYITEIATYTTGQPQPTALQAWGVEVFNPYNMDIVAAGEYAIVEDDPATTGFDNRVPLPGLLRAGQFTAFITDPGNKFGLSSGPSPTNEGTIVLFTSTRQLSFRNGWNIYLVRQVQYPDPVTGAMVNTDIVLDQFPATDANIGLPDPPANQGTPAELLVRSERVASLSANPPLIWTAPVPTTAEQTARTMAEETAPTLGSSNKHVPTPPPHPVEIQTADTGTFTREPAPGAGFVANPTTGTLLLLPRHANRSLADFQIPAGLAFAGTQTTNLAFTTWLNDTITAGAESPPNTNNPTVVDVAESAQIDNGRMPVFDRGFTQVNVGTGNIDVIAAAHHVLPRRTPPNRQGSAATVPWGQFVFDHFTVLPLNNPGPYRGRSLDPNIPFEPGRPESTPRVDQNGLRVHGRVNINAAPWTVLSGLPIMPATRFPPGPIRNQAGSFAATRTTCDGGTNHGNLCLNDSNCPGGQCLPAATIGPQLAQAIVAYREQRAITDASGNTTGNYADGTGAVANMPPFGRGWNHPDPAIRRGTGFLSVGELANVRHFGAAPGVFRLDNTFVAPQADGADYFQAVSGLVALNEWATTRSNVATVYGIIRGAQDQDLQQELTAQGLTGADLEKVLAADVDARAIRFQETIDRLPALLGKSAPTRIGQRVVAPYNDATND